MPDARSAGAGADAKEPVLKKGGPTVWELLIAFGIGAAIPLIALIVLLVHHSAAVESYETKVSVLENNFIARIETLIQKIEGKKPTQ